MPFKSRSSVKCLQPQTPNSGTCFQVRKGRLGGRLSCRIDFLVFPEEGERIHLREFSCKHLLQKLPSMQIKNSMVSAMLYEAENQFRNKLLYADSLPSLMSCVSTSVDFLHVEGTRRTGSTLNSRMNSNEGTEDNADIGAAVDMVDAASHADGLSGTLKSHRGALIAHFSSLP